MAGGGCQQKIWAKNRHLLHNQAPQGGPEPGWFWSLVIKELALGPARHAGSFNSLALLKGLCGLSPGPGGVSGGLWEEQGQGARGDEGLCAKVVARCGSDSCDGSVMVVVVMVMWW